MASDTKRSPDPRERRKHRRFSAPNTHSLLVPRVSSFLSIFGKKRVNVAETLIDLSEGGALFVTNGRVRVGTRVEILLTFGSFGDTLSAEGEVVRCSHNPGDTRTYLVGIRFNGLQPAQIRKIEAVRSYIESPAYLQKTTRRYPAIRPHPDAPPSAKA